MLRFAWVVIIAAELLAITQIMNFQFPEGYLKDRDYPLTTLEWSFGQNTSPSVWVGLFLVTIGLFNCLPVKFFGMIEYVFGCMKIIFITGLIMFNVVLNARKR
jgi:amino acid transporter